jgi:polysaccharide export outer membrane protein
MKKYGKILLLLGALALFVSVCASAQDYVIGESDMLAINVWHEQELTRVLPVRADGKISLPLIGDLAASGSTPAQLQATIVEKLHSYMENPEVTVIVQEPRSQYFTVVGEVMKPGAYPLGQRLSVLDGLAMAGGFKDFAKVKRMYILRTGRDGTTEKRPFNYKKALGGDTTQNFILTARDTIVVP